MQPDMPTIEKDENQPQEALSESLPIPDVSQLESVPVQEIPIALSPAPEKKRSKLRLTSIVLGILIFLFFVAFAWVGYWTYQLNTQLTDTQQQLASLQAEHEKLQADYQTLSGEKDKVNADLEKANTDLANVQADLSKSQQKSSDLTRKMEKAGKLFDVVYVWITSTEASDIFKINSQIEKSGDQNLINKWNALKKSPSDDAVDEFIEYLLKTTRDSLK